MPLDPLLLLHARVLQIVDEYVAIHEEVLQFSLSNKSSDLHANAGQLEVLEWRLGDVAGRVPAAVAEEHDGLRVQFGAEVAAYARVAAQSCSALCRLSNAIADEMDGRASADRGELRKKYDSTMEAAVQRRLALDELHTMLTHRARPARA